MFTLTTPSGMATAQAHRAAATRTVRPHVLLQRPSLVPSRRMSRTSVLGPVPLRAAAAEELGLSGEDFYSILGLVSVSESYVRAVCSNTAKVHCQHCSSNSTGSRQYCGMPGSSPYRSACSTTGDVFAWKLCTQERIREQSSCKAAQVSAD